MIGVGSLAWARGGGRSPAGPRHHSRPMWGPHRSIDRHIGRRCARNVAKRPWEGATREAQWPIGPRTAGWGIAARLRWMPLDNWSTSQEDERAKLRAVAGSPAHLSKRRLAARRGDAIADRPLDCRRVRPDDQPTSQWSFLFPMRPLQSASIEAN